MLFTDWLINLCTLEENHVNKSFYEFFLEYVNANRMSYYYDENAWDDVAKSTYKLLKIHIYGCNICIYISRHGRNCYLSTTFLMISNWVCEFYCYFYATNFIFLVESIQNELQRYVNELWFGGVLLYCIFCLWPLTWSGAKMKLMLIVVIITLFACIINIPLSLASAKQTAQWCKHHPDFR